MTRVDKRFVFRLLKLFFAFTFFGGLIFLFGYCEHLRRFYLGLIVIIYILVWLGFMAVLTNYLDKKIKED